jgi:putative ABC transport system permease protein
MRARELMGEGWDEAAARAEAQRLFGDMAAIRGECTVLASRHRRTRRWTSMWQELIQDVRYAARWMARSPGFTLVAVLTLALGIGANTAAFGIVNGVLLSPLPYPEPDQLAAVREVGEGGSEMNTAWPNFQDWQARSRQSTLAAHTQAYPESVVGGAEPVRVQSAQVTGEFFNVMGVAPAVGRTFLAEELVPGGSPAVVVSHHFWRMQLEGERDLSRLVLHVHGNPAQVVGVMPPGFSYPAGAQLWYPVELLGFGPSRTAHNFQVTARLAQGATLESARAELNAIMREIRERETEVNAVGVAMHNLREHTVGGSRRALLTLLAASGFVLLVACTNLASALLARATQRSRELAIRASLGAPRLRLIRQLLTESLLLSLIGAAAGLLLAHVLIDAVRHVGADAVPRLHDVGIDGWVLGFTTLIAVATALTFGTAPALRATAAQPWQSMTESSRGGSGGPRQRRAWSVLVGAEVALALMLLVGAGLLIRSFWNVLNVDPGFDPDRVLAVTLALPEHRYPGEARVAYYDAVLEEIRTLPGVRSAAMSRTLPLVGGDPGGRFSIASGAEEFGNARYRVVGPDFFTTLRIPVLHGRTFTAADRAGSLPVAVINEQLARRYFPDRDPIGARITTGGMDRQGQDVHVTVIGVVGDVRGSLTGESAPAYYLPYTQRWARTGDGVLVVRTAGPPGSVAPALRARIRARDGEVPVELATLRSHIGESLADRRFVLLLLGGFAGIALLLAAVGIYGVVAFAVAQRTREIGIRVALGAEHKRVLWLVSRATMTGVVTGVAVGLAGAFVVSRLVAFMLYEVDAVDPLTFIAVALLLLFVAWIAVLVPAHRATRISPLNALRAE